MARENGDFSRCADPVPLRFHAKVKEGRILFPPKASNCLLLRRHGLDNFDLTAIVAAALLAHSVRQVQSTALGACNETGDSQLPGGAASLIASCFGYFSLRYCHCDTSLIYKGQAALFILYLFSKSFARTARRGSTSFLQEQGPRFRSAPQWGQSPLQSSEHRVFVSMSRIKASRANSPAST